MSGGRAAAVREGAGIFPLRRGVLEVAGGDRRRWLNGMVTVDVSALEPGPTQSGRYALLLSHKGRILADLHVLERGDRFLVDTDAEHAPSLLATLDRHLIADDVQLSDVSDAFARFGVEGPGAAALLERATGTRQDLARDACADAMIAGAPVTLAAFGWSGEPAFQVFAPAREGDAVEAALVAAGGADVVRGDEATLEVLRIEAGVPRLGAELDEDVFPSEAHLLARAVSLTKGCYTGQEIVARIESRGQVHHQLVGLHFEGDALPSVGESLVLGAGEKPVGEVTSVCRSQRAGAIGLGFARRPHDAPGTALRAGAVAARVAALPFVGSSPDGP